MLAGRLRYKAEFYRIQEAKNALNILEKTRVSLFSRRCDVLSTKAAEYYAQGGEQGTQDVYISVRLDANTESLFYDDIFNFDGKKYEIKALHPERRRRRIVIFGKYNSLIER